MIATQKRILISPYAIPGVSPVKLSFEHIIEAVCSVKQMDRSDLFLQTRLRKIVEARQLCWFLARKYTKMPLMQLGHYFGKDHATAIHGVRTVQNMIDTDREFHEYVALVESKLLTRNQKVCPTLK